MSGATEAKQDLLDNLSGTGYKVLTYVPENVNPPVLLVAPEDGTYLEPDTTFKQGVAKINLIVICVVPTKVNQQMSLDMDTMIEKVLLSLGNGWYWNRVEGPYFQRVNDRYRLSSIISVSNIFELED